MVVAAITLGALPGDASAGSGVAAAITLGALPGDASAGSGVAAAITDTQRNLWWGAIIGGLVIVLAVAALLTVLVVLVRRIDQRVVQVRDTLRAAEANTADTALIAETAERVDAVLAEGLKHHLFLGRVLDKVRS
jgi:Na+-transporting methylmalonyl-CoA/oxaloacetate decarboxylase gamma subunit